MGRPLRLPTAKSVLPPPSATGRVSVGTIRLGAARSWRDTRRSARRPALGRVSADSRRASRDASTRGGSSTTTGRVGRPSVRRTRATGCTTPEQRRPHRLGHRRRRRERRSPLRPRCSDCVDPCSTAPPNANNGPHIPCRSAACDHRSRRRSGSNPAVVGVSSHWARKRLRLVGTGGHEQRTEDLGSSPLHHPAVAHRQYTVHMADHVEVMGGDERGDTGGSHEIVESLKHHFRGGRVEIACRFIRQ